MIVCGIVRLGCHRFFFFVVRYCVVIVVLTDFFVFFFVFLCRVSYIFGLIAMLAGLVGVPLGSFLGQKLRVRYPRADALVCGGGLLFSTPFLLAGLVMAGWNTTACFSVIFFGQVLLNLNWSIVADMCLVCMSFLSVGSCRF